MTLSSKGISISIVARSGPACTSERTLTSYLNTSPGSQLSCRLTASAEARMGQANMAISANAVEFRFVFTT